MKEVFDNLISELLISQKEMDYLITCVNSEDVYTQSCVAVEMTGN